MKLITCIFLAHYLCSGSFFILDQMVILFFFIVLKCKCVLTWNVVQCRYYWLMVKTFCLVIGNRELSYWGCMRMQISMLSICFCRKLLLTGVCISQPARCNINVLWVFISCGSMNKMISLDCVITMQRCIYSWLSMAFWLVVEFVTVCGQVNHIGILPTT